MPVSEPSYGTQPRTVLVQDGHAYVDLATAERIAEERDRCAKTLDETVVRAQGADVEVERLREALTDIEAHPENAEWVQHRASVALGYRNAS